MKKLRKFFLGIGLGLLILLSVFAGTHLRDLPSSNPLVKIFSLNKQPGEMVVQGKVLKEESVVIDVVSNVGPSVVTVGIVQKARPSFDLFDPFGFFGLPKGGDNQEPVEEDIGSGFIVSNEGLIVTNKHVVSDTTATYQVFLSDNKAYPVEKVYRDPVNDIAILKISAPADQLKPVELGDSSSLRVGQFVVAIGTALGEFRNTVTQGVISGLGRGITAGSPFEGYIENIDGVIQTDAAINPGNSGGPLVNSISQVIGVNTAVARGAQNIGFSIPINIVKETLDNFNNTGQFTRAFLGVRTRYIDQKEAISKGWVQGAGVIEVISGSAAEEGGVKEGDIVKSVDGEKIDSADSLARIISKKKVGETVKIVVWRNEEEVPLQATLKSQ